LPPNIREDFNVFMLGFIKVNVRDIDPLYEWRGRLAGTMADKDWWNVVIVADVYSH
jgi:hypothetical protein